jgi:hypothetical protein
MRKGHDAYLAAIRRQAARFQALADAFGGSDPVGFANSGGLVFVDKAAEEVSPV